MKHDQATDSVDVKQTLGQWRSLCGLLIGKGKRPFRIDRLVKRELADCVGDGLGCNSNISLGHGVNSELPWYWAYWKYTPNQSKLKYTHAGIDWVGNN